MNPLVSIIIPTYNRAKILQNAIESVKCQTYLNWELIIVDDNHSDSLARKQTQKIIREYKDDLRIKYILHDKNKGACAARNTGWKVSSAKYIAFLDDDDLWFEHKLEKQVSLLEKTGSALCYSDMNIEYQGKTRYSKCLPSNNFFISLLNQGYGICTSALLLTREALKCIDGFDNTLPSMQDYDLLLRISEKYQCEHIKEALLTYYLADDGISCNPYSKSEGHRLIIKKYKNKFIELSLFTGLSRQYESFADFEIRCDHRISSMKYYFKALFYNSLSYRVMLKMLFGIFMGKLPLETFLKSRQHFMSKKLSKK